MTPDVGARGPDGVAGLPAAVAVPAATTATVQETHPVLVHLLCAVVDSVLAGAGEKERP
ncbi:MAG: hypothetical protein ACXVJ7_00110 [Acidimicrobiia bacterium]